MTKELYRSSTITLLLLATAVLQACVGGHLEPAVLSVKTQPSKTSSKIGSSAVQPEGKHSSAQQPKVQSPKKHKNFNPKTRRPFLQHTSSSSGHRRYKPIKRASSLSPPLTRQPLPVISEDKVLKDFDSSADSKTDKLHQGPALPSLESLLKQLQVIDMDDLKAYADCLEAIAKTVSPSSVARVQNALGQVHHELKKAPKGAEDSLAIRRILKIIGTIQADLAHFQRILGEEVPATSSVCCSGCCEETPEIDFHRVGKIVRTYPGMAEAVVVKVLDQDNASLFYNPSFVVGFNNTKADFFDDCLTVYPQHAKKLLLFMNKAMQLPSIETATLDVLASFVEKNPAYASLGMRVLNTTFWNFSCRMRSSTLAAFARMLHVCPQCSQYVDQERLCHALTRLQSALKGPEPAMKALAEEVLKQIEACKASFLRREWNHYLQTCK